MTRSRVAIAPAVVSRTSPSDVRRIAVTSVRVRISPPRAMTASPRARANRPQSMIPVPGTWSARRPRTSGSTSSIASGPISRRVTPLARARSAMAASRGSSASSVATMSSPQISYGIPCSSAKAMASRIPSAQRRALSDPGA